MSDDERRLSDLHDILSHLEKIAAKFRIVGDGVINFEGSLKHGFIAFMDTAGGGGGAADTLPAICQGVFDDVWPVAASESYFDVIINLPYDITVTQIVMFGETTFGILLNYGAEGEGASIMVPTPQPAGTLYANGVGGTNMTDANGVVGPTTIGELTLVNANEMLGAGDGTRGYAMNQFVPAGGYLQLNTDQMLESGDISFFIHYIYNCADAP